MRVLSALTDPIEAEEARSRAAQDESNIRAFFEKYSHADLYDPTARDTVIDYFVDRILLYEDQTVVTGWYTDLHHETAFEELFDGVKDDDGLGYLPDSSSGFACFADGGTRPRRVELGFNRYQFALRIWME